MNTNILKLIPVLAILVLSACGRAPQKDVGPFGDFVQKFEQKSAEQGHPVKVTDLVMKFGPMDDPRERGVCVIEPGKPPTITIDQDAFQKMDVDAQEALLAHEMGHCVLFRVHNPEYSQPGVPSSLMIPYTMNGKVFANNESHYWKELFSRENEL